MFASPFATKNNVELFVGVMIVTLSGERSRLPPIMIGSLPTSIVPVTSNLMKLNRNDVIITNSGSHQAWPTHTAPTTGGKPTQLPLDGCVEDGGDDVITGGVFGGVLLKFGVGDSDDVGGELGVGDSDDVGGELVVAGEVVIGVERSSK